MTAWPDLDAMIGKTMAYWEPPELPEKLHGVVKEWRFTHADVEIEDDEMRPGVQFLIEPVEGDDWVWSMTYAYTPEKLPDVEEA